METNLIKSDREYNRILENMRGVDFSGSAGAKNERYAYLENMYRDYTAGKGGLIESVPGFRRIYSGSSINGLHLQTTADGERYVIIHNGSKLLRYNVKSGESPTNVEGSYVMVDSKSYSFNFFGTLYIGDGTNIFAVSDDGTAQSVNDNTGYPPYIPTVFVDGVDYEERNLSTTKFYEKHTLLPVGKLAHGTASLLYRVTDSERRLCAVSGISDNTSDVYIPSIVRLGERDYTVDSIDSAAFSKVTTIKSVSLSDSVKRIGVGAFYGATSLTKVICGSGLTDISDQAFYTSGLREIYLPANLSSIGTSALPTAATIKYELGDEAYKNIAGKPTNTVEYGVRVETVTLGIKLRTRTKSIISVTVDGEAVSYTTHADKSGYITEIVIANASKHAWTGKTLEVLGYAYAYVAQPDVGGQNFTSRTTGSNYSFTNAIRQCTHASVTNGRVFLWGNPRFPGVTFYSQPLNSEKRGLYFGALSYIDEGSDATILSVLGLSNGAAVLSSGSSGGERIRLHLPDIISEPVERTVYRVSEAHRGDEPIGAAMNFDKEILYVSANGLSAIGENSLYHTKAIKTYSAPVSPMLAKERLANATLAVWCGYIVLSIDGRMYLADPRTEDGGEGDDYEWFFLNRIGTYKNASRVYRYSSLPKERFLVPNEPDGVAVGEVWSETDETGELVYFINTDEGRLEVYPTEEFSGGDFYPARITLGFGEHLIFSTDCGDVCAFNSDMRGVAPERIAAADDFDAEEYAERMGDRIHPDFYAFLDHAPRYALITAADDCDIPHLKKSTVKRSLVLKLATFVGGRVFCEVGRDGEGFHRVGVVDGGVADFSTLSFESLPFDGGESVSVTLPERERGWVEKSLSLFSNGFRSPIGVYSICYRYRISGRIK